MKARQASIFAQQSIIQQAAAECRDIMQKRTYVQIWMADIASALSCSPIRP